MNRKKRRGLSARFPNEDSPQSVACVKVGLRLTPEYFAQREAERALWKSGFYTQNTKSVGVPVFNVTKSQEKSKHSKGKRIWKLQNAEEAESEAEILYQDDPRDECLYTYSNHSKKSKSSRHSEGERYFIGNRDTSKYRQSTVKYPCCTPKYRQNAQDLIIIRTMVCWSVERLEGALRLERVFRRIGMSRFQTL